MDAEQNNHNGYRRDQEVHIENAGFYSNLKNYKKQRRYTNLIPFYSYVLLDSDHLVLVGLFIV